MRLASALRDRFKEGYSLSDLRADFFSGLIVGLVALPLAMALAIAIDVPPHHGITTAIIAGFFVPLLGGSRFQVTGPTAAFLVILVPIVHQFGVAGLLVAGLMAGIMLVIMGLTGLGQLVYYIPYPVTTGFTSGIAVVITILQLKDFFGLSIESMPESFIGRALALGGALPGFSTTELSVGLTTLGLLLLFQSTKAAQWTLGWSRKIPAPLVVMVAMTLGTLWLRHLFPNFDVATLRSRFGYPTDDGFYVGIPQSLPSFTWPWNFDGPVGDHSQAMIFGSDWHSNFKLIEALMLPALSIAILGAIESLLSAVVADGLGKTRHDPNTELTALGIGNIISPLFGGIAAVGGLSRTATNIRYGARSPLSAMIHAIFILVIVLSLAPAMSYVPMASLAALLVVVAIHMFEVKQFKRILRSAPRSDKTILLTCFVLTIVFDMIVGVTTGIVIAALLFIKRMADFSSHELETPSLTDVTNDDPHFVVYRIAGPLFFGAAQKAITTLERVDRALHGVIFDFRDVPVMDITGMVALENCFETLKRRGQKIILRNLSQQPLDVIRESGWLHSAHKTEAGLEIKYQDSE